MPNYLKCLTRICRCHMSQETGQYKCRSSCRKYKNHLQSRSVAKKHAVIEVYRRVWICRSLFGHCELKRNKEQSGTQDAVLSHTSKYVKRTIANYTCLVVIKPLYNLNQWLQIFCWGYTHPKWNSFRQVRIVLTHTHTQFPSESTSGKRRFQRRGDNIQQIPRRGSSGNLA